MMTRSTTYSACAVVLLVSLGLGLEYLYVMDRLAGLDVFIILTLTAIGVVAARAFRR